MVRNIIIEAISYAFVILFTYAAVSKLIDMELFKAQVSQSPFLISYAQAVAWSVPIVELVITGLLLVSQTRLMALYFSFGLMVAFTTYIIAILNFSNSIPCSCGGVLSSMGWTTHLIFNLGFVILAVVAIWMILKKQGQTNEVSNSLRNQAQAL